MSDPFDGKAKISTAAVISRAFRKQIFRKEVSDHETVPSSFGCKT